MILSICISYFWFQIEEVVKEVNVYEFIFIFEEGYNIFVGERGVRLSGGQKQRIVIVRVFIMNFVFFLFDEVNNLKNKGLLIIIFEYNFLLLCFDEGLQFRNYFLKCYYEYFQY